MTSKPEKTRTPQDHFLIRTVTYRIPVDRSDPASVADAYAALAPIPDTTALDKDIQTEVSKPKFWNKPKAE